MAIDRATLTLDLRSRFNAVDDSNAARFDPYFPNVDPTDGGCLRNMRPAAGYRYTGSMS